MSEQSNDALTPPLGGEVHIEPHGVPGTSGHLAGELKRPRDEHFSSSAMWLSSAGGSDVHVAFRAELVVEEQHQYQLDIQASSNFRLWVDGHATVCGPLRYAPSIPEFHSQTLLLAAGTHSLAVHAVAESLTNRMSASLPSFVWLRLRTQQDEVVPLKWVARRLVEYAQTGLRISPLLGWMEWRDQPLDPGWRTSAVADMGWTPVDRVDGLDLVLGDPTPSSISLPQWPLVQPTKVSSGVYRDTYPGYRWDDPAVQFLLADPDPDPRDDADGFWVRYDLGRIRIGSLEFTIEAEAPAEVTVAYSERLGPDNRPAPVVALSAGPTRMIQHFSVGPGAERIEPLQAIGGRWVEVRVQSTAPAKICEPLFRERDFLGAPTGAIQTGDAALERIWAVGIETLRASAEDALVDSVRERGEWVGDVVSSALEMLSIGWGDLRLGRRALLHAAAGAREDGLVAGCGPGELLYLGTYAAQWVTACVRCAELEGDTDVLRELEEPARHNMTALVALVNGDGSNSLPWTFVDWGYKSRNEVADVAVLCHVIQALDSWIRWQELLHSGVEVLEWHQQRDRLAGIVRAEIDKNAGELGYHASTLAALVGLMDSDVAAKVVHQQLSKGFPFNPNGSRLRDGTQAKSDAVTPYFTNYSMRLLFESGDADSVHDLWRRGWGWMLERGATTWWEVFDDRWSQCHYWSSAPTWQMSRYLLGMWPSLDASGPVIDIAVYPGSLPLASGRVPLPRGGVAKVQWSRVGDAIEYNLITDGPVVLRTRSGLMSMRAGSNRLILERAGVEVAFRVA